MNATQDSLQAAIAAIGAVGLGEGWYAYRSGANRGNFVSVSEERFEREAALVPLSELRNVLIVFAKLLPSWWTPEYRFALRERTGRYTPCVSAVEAADFKRNGQYYGATIVTVEYQTGLEVAA